jgi:hypothetical protein
MNKIALAFDFINDSISEILVISLRPTKAIFLKHSPLK